MDNLRLLVPVDDPTTGQVIWREFYNDSVVGDDADVVLPHLAADRRQDEMAVGEFNTEHRVRQCLNDGPLQLEGAFLLSHVS